LRLGPPPKGFGNWTLRLLAERAGEVIARATADDYAVVYYYSGRPNPGPASVQAGPLPGMASSSAIACRRMPGYRNYCFCWADAAELQRPCVVRRVPSQSPSIGNDIRLISLHRALMSPA
jgi:hypothetical protein